MAAFGGGYTCVTCGQWVPEGATHYCSGMRPVMTYPTVPFSPPTDLSRVEALLERIALALEELIEITSPEKEETARDFELVQDPECCSNCGRDLHGYKGHLCRYCDPLGEAV